MSRIKNTLKYWKLVTTNVVLMQFNRAIWGIVSVTICWTRAFKISNVKLYYIDRACLILFAVFVLSSVTRLSYFPYKSVTLYKWPKYRNVGLSVADIDHRQNSSFWRGSSKQKFFRIIVWTYTVSLKFWFSEFLEKTSWTEQKHVLH